MRINCIHGYFKFEENEPGELSQFASRFGLSIVRREDHFTFEDLKEAPTHSLVGGLFLLAPCTARFEGQPWEVMRENALVYNFSLGLVVPILTIVTVAKVRTAGNYFISSGMLLPGSLTDEGKRVTDYAAHFSFRDFQFRYSEVTYE